MVLITILLIILAVLSIWFRKQITGLTGTVKDYAIGNWYRAYPIFRKALIFGGVGWGVLIVLMIGIGAYANSIEAALIISILFPFWFLSMLIPRRTVPSLTKWRIPIFGIIRVFGGFVLVFAALSLAFGIWSPGSKDALNERYEDAKVASENSIRKGHEQSERNAGVRGWIINDTHLYDETYTAVQSLKKDEEIYITNIKGGKSANNQRAAVLPAMLKNKDGDFFRGREGWVPTMNIGWEKPNNTEVPRTSAKDPAASAVPGESWELCLQREDIPWRGNVKLKKSNSNIKIEGTGEGGWFIFEGERTANNNQYQYKGNWKNSHSGEIFSLEFNPDQKTATGCFIGSESHKKKKMWLTKNE